MTVSTLRPAQASDFPFIHRNAGRKENLTFIEDSPDDVLQAYIEDVDAALLIWIYDGSPAGFALFNELTHPDQQTELRRLALDQTDTGLGQLFLKDLVHFGLMTLGKDRVWLDVAPENARAIRSYNKAGFCQDHNATKIWHRRDGVSVDLLVFNYDRSDGPRGRP
ncbi:Protein N-acetyltransferase, RimJ/RimL family [Shimia gijangensis]|uniref:Protein N-acetyltransferase, RimJ/RimL family n=1 Tax=Shimia gijangensis TaxID=1470563 RepID=A0A1M6EPN5_9RHOB|nr:GNAT family N-acetyltransferase [Shimia gijangensis]SHI87403.1 Protein N-acetyltransferase, RimJ/RimL family [Shimia gijangensis]